MALSFDFLLAMIFAGLGAGLPLGIPPADEDPLMARVAPEECLAYLSWSGSAKADAASANQLEQLLAEPELRLCLNEIERLLTNSIKQFSEDEGPEMEFVATEGYKWGRRLLSSPTAAFVSKFEIGPAGPIIEAGALVNVGADAAELDALLKKIKDEILRDAMSEVEIGGATMYQFQPAPDAPVFTFGVKGDYFYAGAGEGAVEGILERAETEPPVWLTDLRKQLSVDRTSLVAYVNAESIIEMTLPMLRPEESAVLRELFSLDKISSVACVTGLDDTGYVSRTQVGIKGELTGLISAADAEPLTVDDLSPIPRDATLALAVRLDADKFYESVVAAMEKVDPRMRGEFEEEVGEMEEELGLRVRADLLKSLGDVMCIYHSSGEGGLIGGFTGVVKVEDRAGLARVNDVISTNAKELAAREREVGFGQFQFAGQTVSYVTFEEVPISPSWCLTDDELIVGLYPQNIKAYLSRGDDFQSLAKSPEVAKAFASGDGPFKLYYQDTPALFELAYPAALIFARVITGELQREEIDFDMSILPSGQSIHKHLRPDVLSVTRTAAGIEVTNRQSFPGSGNSWLLPVAAFIGMEGGMDIEEVFEGLAMVLSPNKAKEVQAMNNLKWIGLALHNYHDVYARFPAAVMTDDSGKPLLSWRVHILPFIEHAHLYDQFHLDEPWDSEHNKKLIDQMPDVFKAPGSKQMPGMTSILSLRGENTIFPGKEKIGLRDVTDGTSNTIMVVEATDDAAVVWTKPDDLELDPMKPGKNLVGLRKNAFLALFGDGSVRRIPETIDKQTLMNLFMRDDGNVIDHDLFDPRRRRARVDAVPLDAAPPVRVLDLPAEPAIPEDGGAAVPR